MKTFFIVLVIILGISGCSEEKDIIKEGKILSAETDSYKLPNNFVTDFDSSKANISNPPLDTKDDSNEEASDSDLVETEIWELDFENETTQPFENKFADFSPVSQEAQLLKTYSTKILTSDNNRYHNISIVTDRLNDYVLPAGATFSFNEVCGPYGQSDGFLEATILLSDGTESKGFGGGVCQLSSTLYNAVKDLNITITEHHHHSKPVAYVPANQDATVSLQSNLDFKFRNDYTNDLIFKTSHDPNNVSISVFKLGDAP